MRVGIDVDGVLAEFNAGFIALVKEKLGVELPPVSENYPDTWNYDIEALKVHYGDEQRAKEASRELWGTIAASHSFWMKLQPISQPLLYKLADVAAMHTFYFITSRPGGSAKFQTEAWLLKWFALPTVLIASDKGPVAKSLGLELFIDDKPENANEVAEATEGKCLVLMPERPWNRNVVTDARVARVKNLEKALSHVLGFNEELPLRRVA
jgi:uncharacterized HAD superfamily protein